MHKRRLTYFSIFATVTVVVATFLLVEPQTESAQNQETITPHIATDVSTMTDSLSPLTDAPTEVNSLPSKVWLDVPFTPQTPFGEWSDLRQDYGCEEASSLMVWHWLQNKPLTLQEAKAEIIALSEWQLERYNDFHDRSTGDTAEMFREYFQYDRVRVAYDIGISDIRRELASGNAVIVPVHGQKLDNPYFTPPGPVQHMVVVRGYDDETREFIVNDPGTKRGEAIRYRYDTLMTALQDYGTGWNEPIEEIRSAMIVVEKSGR